MHSSCYDDWVHRGNRIGPRVSFGCPTCRGPVQLGTSEHFQWDPTQHPKQMLALMILERAEPLLRTHYHDGPRNAALQQITLHPSMERHMPWATWPPRADRWASYLMRLWDCMGPPPHLPRRVGLRYSGCAALMGPTAWLDHAYWSHPEAAMPWGTCWEDSPGCGDDTQCAHLTTHPDIALWRWAYMDLNRHWILNTPLPPDYLDSSLQHLCGGG